jgi:hypothetical protein
MLTIIENPPVIFATFGHLITIVVFQGFHENFLGNLRLDAFGGFIMDDSSRSDSLYV